MRKNLFKILSSGFILVATNCSETLAYSWNTKACEDSSASTCYKCNSSNTCTATLYHDGRLVISGNGNVTACEVCLNDTFQNSTIKPTSLKIEEGITDISVNAFWGISSIKTVELPSSVATVGSDGLNLRGSYQLIINENSALTTFDRNWGSAGYVSSVFCKGNSDICRTKLENANPSFQNKTITDELYDANHHLIEKCSSSGCITYDSSERKTALYSLDDKILEKYDILGHITEEYTYDDNGHLLSWKNHASDGSISTYDTNGNLIGLQGKRIYTINEASALVKNNKNTFSIRYR